MSASTILRSAPLGALIGYSDGTTRPPDRHRRKLEIWRRSNGAGRLVEIRPEFVQGSCRSPASFSLHLGDYGADGVVVLSALRTYDARSRLRFEVLRSPRPGSVLCLTRYDGAVELRHLAADISEARRWAAAHVYLGLLFETPCDELASRPVPEDRSD